MSRRNDPASVEYWKKSEGAFWRCDAEAKDGEQCRMYRHHARVENDVISCVCRVHWLKTKFARHPNASPRQRGEY